MSSYILIEPNLIRDAACFNSWFEILVFTETSIQTRGLHSLR